MATTKKNNAPVNSKNKMLNSNGSKNGTEKAEKTLEDLFEEGLKHAYSFETQLIDALPKMAKAAYSEELQDAFEKHLHETKRQAERLEKILSRLNIDKSSVEKCVAMEGLIKEGNDVIENYEESPVRDSAMIIGAQKIEHHEIAAYGSLHELADVLGHGSIMDMLERSLKEEEQTDHALTSIAKSVNDEAYEQNQSKKEAKEPAEINY